jgi:NAD(P)-dependent dehydrogenase (short-subunit alcohol dehydrogenase family)
MQASAGMSTSQPHRETVVITGASAGVGRALARAYARRGSVIGLIARGRAGLVGARKDVEALGGTPIVIQADVADAEAMDAGAELVESRAGPIDTWINNAMTSVFSPVSRMTAAEFRRVTEVTYLGAVNGTLAALRRMLPRDRGTIVLVGSALAYRGIPLQAAYCGAKHAMQGFHDSLRTELQHDGSNVIVTMVQLPAVNTPQFSWVRSRLPKEAQPVPPIYQPEVVADGILWAADHPGARRELNIGYPAVKAIWGNKLVPSYADHVLADSGYSAQQTDTPEPPGRPDNLWQPLDEDVDHGAHGAFDDRAKSFSWQLWADTHRGVLAAGAVGAAIVGTALGAAARRGSPLR